MLFESASSVIVVPGYGMAVAQAQHIVRELSDMLERRGTSVKFAIHPVARPMSLLWVHLADTSPGKVIYIAPVLAGAIFLCLQEGSNKIIPKTTSDIYCTGSKLS